MNDESISWIIEFSANWLFRNVESFGELPIGEWIVIDKEHLWWICMQFIWSDLNEFLEIIFDFNFIFFLWFSISTSSLANQAWFVSTNQGPVIFLKTGNRAWGNRRRISMNSKIHFQDIIFQRTLILNCNHFASLEFYRRRFLKVRFYSIVVISLLIGRNIAARWLNQTYITVLWLKMDKLCHSCM